MNIAQPIASEVKSVEFKFLTLREIRAISVRRIENENTFDNLLNPVSGGLYDPALGSWGDSPCSTCNLNQAHCPGHAGHIQLPVPLYHPVFMDQAFRLLRAACVYCKGFRLSAKRLHLYICQLRLLQYGLVDETLSVGLIEDNELALDMPILSRQSDDEADEEGAVSSKNIIRSRERYVRHCLEAKKLKRGDVKTKKHEGASAMRRKIVKDFLWEITKSNTCANCGGISPAYRRDRCVKIFEKSLSKKEKAKMVMKNLTPQDAFTGLHNLRQKLEKPYSETDDHAFDRAVADVRSTTLDAAPEVNVLEPANESSTSHPHARDDGANSQRFITSMEVKARLEELFVKEQELLMVLYNAQPPTRNCSPITADMFFITMILVPPNRFRPEARTGSSQIAEAQQNSLYKSILKGCGKIARIHNLYSYGEGGMDMMYQAWTQLQESVNALIDTDQNPLRGIAANRNVDGIKQKLEKKEGLFRMNLMGKRVNFAARSVISPDPNIDTNEIGVPPVFARKLTFPEPVTSHNFRDMQQAVINGVETWPGASAIENETGQLITLRNKSTDERLSLANQLLAPSNSNAARQRNKKVHRHLTNGDVVLMNRQPTLHKPSIMGHRVRVLPGEKTLRMHYANCNTYNADFDGDEMNLHFPQNEVARVEALQISDTDHQYISVTTGNPLRGLIQDHVSIAVLLCSLDTFFNKQGYCQLLYSALRPENGHIVCERIQLVSPAIMKPVARWTGKQIITSILENIQPPNCGALTMRRDAQIKAEQWGDKSEEGSVLIKANVLITGVLDKSQIGSASGGLIHAVHEVYGPTVAGKLLSSFGRLLTSYLSMQAFSCGMDDLRLTEKGEKLRQKELRATEGLGLKIASHYVSLTRQENTSCPILLERLEEVLRDDSKQEGLDLLMNQGTNDITSAVQKACIPYGLEKPFPVNQMQAMTTSGAKGTRVNACLISCNLGQQNLEGRRVPLMVSGKSLPCFKPFDTSVRAAGYIMNRFLTGVRPQEYYFHHMAGREGLIDTAVKTSRSGYLQRCLIKGLEGLTVAYDTTVRDADGSMIQFLYGEDGLDISKLRYLLDFKFILQNVASEVAQLRYDPKVGKRLGANRAAFGKYMRRAIKHAKAQDRHGSDPLASLYDPATNAFVTSEVFYESMSGYLKEDADGLLQAKGDRSGQRSSRVSLNRKNAEMLFAMKYLRSLVEPGEAVGIIAGQSVGEPSTQMTLNTFHLAGHSARNVTQGILRLREILMTASDRISHPRMTLYPLKQLSDEEVHKFARSISILRLSHLLDDIVVEESIGRGKVYDMTKIFDVRLNFFSSENYAEKYGIGADEVYDAIEKRLLHQLINMVKKEIKKRQSHATTATPVIGAKFRGEEETADQAHRHGGKGNHESSDNNFDGNEDNDGDDISQGEEELDLDFTTSKQRVKRKDAVSYCPNDDDDAVQKANECDALASDIEDKGTGCGSSETLSEREPTAIEDNLGLLTPGIKFSSTAGRAERIMHVHHEITHFTYDREKGSWCRLTLEFEVDSPKVLMLKIAQEAVRKTVVQQIQGVGLCNPRRDERGGILIEAEGINLGAMQRLGEQIDVDRVTTNDIAAVLAMYGVEACRKSIVSELMAVFATHAIKVDIRHLNLIADYITRNGDFVAFSRIGIGANISPFTKMSFETTLSFLKDAVLDGDWDELVTPSSRLVLGRLGLIGTGGFDVLTQMPMH